MVAYYWEEMHRTFNPTLLKRSRCENNRYDFQKAPDWVSRACKPIPASKDRLRLIRAELAWVNETPDPNKCGCRNLRCCEETGRRPGAGPVATKFWTCRWEYSCAPSPSMYGTVPKRVNTWSPDKRKVSPP